MTKSYATRVEYYSEALERRFFGVTLPSSRD